LRLELALALYSQDILPFGKAAELSGISRNPFGDLLAKRGIARHYTEVDLELDVSYARGL
jgi:predicted HTH domain antitoxin